MQTKPNGSLTSMWVMPSAYSPLKLHIKFFPYLTVLKGKNRQHFFLEIIAEYRLRYFIEYFYIRINKRFIVVDLNCKCNRVSFADFLGRYIVQIPEIQQYPYIGDQCIEYKRYDDRQAHKIYLIPSIKPQKQKDNSKTYNQNTQVSHVRITGT